MTRLIRLLLISLASAAIAGAQSDASPTLTALLQEVRQLRLAIERTATLAPRMQLLLQRVQLQDGKVSRLSRDLQDVRQTVSQVAADAARMREQLPSFEERARQEQNPMQRTEMESRLRAVKGSLEESAAREQQLRAREAELGSQLRTEQATLDEYQARLDKFEKALDSATSAR